MAKSFGCRHTNLKAIRARGWNPLNRCLLDDADILTTQTNELNDTLTEHENIHGIWAFSGDTRVRSSIIHGTVFNLKRYWCPKNNNIDWSNSSEEFLNEFLFEGSQVKNIWIPYGE